MDIARVNRRAEVCVFLHSTKTAGRASRTSSRYGRYLIVRRDSEDDANDVWLQAAVIVATVLSIKAASHDKAGAASFEKIDKAMEHIRKSIEGFGEINTSANTIKSGLKKS